MPAWFNNLLSLSTEDDSQDPSDSAPGAHLPSNPNAPEAALDPHTHSATTSSQLLAPAVMNSLAPDTPSGYSVSTSTTGDCIAVSPNKTNHMTPAPSEVVNSARSSVGASSEQSTPPTSLGDMTSELDASKEEVVPPSGRRSTRPRTSVGTYNDKVNAGTAVHTRTAYLPRDENGRPIIRTVSGATLVNDTDVEPTEKSLKDGAKRRAMSWTDVDKSGSLMSQGHKKLLGTHSKRRGQLEVAANSVAGAVSSVTSALGKRTRDAMESAKEKLLDTRGAFRAHFADNSDCASEPAPKRMFPNLQARRESAAGEVTFSSMGSQRKKYLAHGLYVGQYRDFNPKLTESKNKMQRHSKGPAQENYVLPLPMFFGEELLKRERDFVMPFEILNPLPRDESPKEWKQLSKNRFIGDAYASWKKVNATLDSSYCDCKAITGGCVDNCINRSMQYECNDSNCRLGPACGNRAFAELKFRGKNKNFCRRREEEKADQNLWGEGVEVLKTEDRGYGVRAMRSFMPGQIIVEYCGEIITQDECDRRMNEDYKEKTDYYLMTFHDKMIIDATKGSIARFVNHSCSPNCRVEKWTVDGEPRMALFAGDEGIVTGEELTYDYNFEAFSKNNVQQCLCGASNCRGVLGPKNGTAPTKDRLLTKTTELVRGIKRKTKQLFNADESSEEEQSQPKRRKMLLGATKSTYNAKSQDMPYASSGMQPSVDEDLGIQKLSREQRAMKRILKSTAPKSNHHEGKIIQRRSISSSLTISELTHLAARSDLEHGRSSMPAYSSNARASRTPTTSKINSVIGKVHRRSEAVKSTVSETVQRKRTWMGAVVESPGPHAKRGPLDAKVDEQHSKTSARHGTWTYALPTPTEEDKMRAIAEGKVKIPKRRSSLAPTRSARVTDHVTAIAKMGLQGDRAVAKRVRHVNGAV